MEKSARASPRPRQQCRPGSSSLEEEDATRGRVPGDETSPQLRKAVGASGARAGRGDPALSQAVAQANGARGLLVRLCGAGGAPPPAARIAKFRKVRAGVACQPYRTNAAPRSMPRLCLLRRVIDEVGNACGVRCTLSAGQPGDPGK